MLSQNKMPIPPKIKTQVRYFNDCCSSMKAQFINNHPNYEDVLLILDWYCTNPGKEIILEPVLNVRLKYSEIRK